MLRSGLIYYLKYSGEDWMQNFLFYSQIGALNLSILKLSSYFLWHANINTLLSVWSGIVFTMFGIFIIANSQVGQSMRKQGQLAVE